MLFWPLLLACRTPDPTTPPGASARDPVAAAEAFFASRPLYERPLADGFAVPAGLSSLSAASCGACHEAQLAEWSISTHAHAWTDLQLQAEMKKSENRWMCQNCHTPLKVQQRQWPIALQDGDVERPVWVDNPAFDAALQQEGINCASCHVRDGVVLGPTGAPTAAHPTAADPSYAAADFCLRCHQAVAEYPGKTFVCTFQTGDEWAAGPYGAAGVPCQSCHMPPQTAERDGQEKAWRYHGFPGGGVPKALGLPEQGEILPPGLVLEPAFDGADLVVTVTNANAGHRVPTGDPERFVMVEASFYAADGSLLGQERARFGQTWQWWPTPKKLADNRLAPTASTALRWALPPGAVEVKLQSSRHRMTEEAADYHDLVGRYPLQGAPVEQILRVP